MTFLKDLFHSHRGKFELHLLFIAAAMGQALALGIGLWLEHKLLDSSATWTTAQQLQVSASPLAKGAKVPVPIEELLATDSTVFTVKFVAFLWIGFSQCVIAYLILSRWNTILQRQKAADANAFARQNHDLIRTRDAVIFGLAKLAESRDPETGHHLERIALYSTRLAEALRRHPKFCHQITPTFMKLLGISSALHDIGKVGVEDAILLKPGRLTDLERRKIERHTILGSDCIEQIENRLGASNFLEMAREIALNHHERWDGKGYPNGLAGTQIPLAARIISVVDVYDALSVRRVYKKAFPHEKCVRIIVEGAGSQFDPDIVEVFLRVEAEFRECAREMSDCIDLEDPDQEPEPEVMTPEQEQILARIIAAENYRAVEGLLVPAGVTDDARFIEPIHTFEESNQGAAL